MAVDSNAMKDRDGNPMQHFTSYPSQLSTGINVFSQDLSFERNPYVPPPPFSLIFPLLKFLKESKVDGVTIIIPDILPRPVLVASLFFSCKKVRSFEYTRVGKCIILSREERFCS